MSEPAEKKISNLSSGVKITVSTNFIPEQSKIEHKLFCYSYTVEIHNSNSTIIKLINRHWKVFAGNRQIADVKGDGVVGKQPIIEPDSSYDYSSYTVIPADYGYMLGRYTFQDASGDFFDVEVPRFDLFLAGENSWH